MAGLAVDLMLQRRTRAVSDAMAARIDAEAGLGGELRSAAWFASRDTRDEWAAFHLARAARRLETVDWRALYPPVRAVRSQVATAALFVAAIALSWSMSSGASARGTAGPARTSDLVPAAGALPGRLELLPADLRKQVEELLAAIERGTLPREQQMKRALDLWNVFSQINDDIDPETLKELAEAMDPARRSADQASKALLEMAGRAQKASEAAGLPPELRRTLEDLGMELAQAADAEQRLAAQEAQNASASAGKAGAPGDAASSSSPSLDQASIQFAKDTQAAAGAGMMMLSSQLGPKGDPASGFGGAGNTGPPPNNGTMPAIEQALRRETIEASEDTTGENVLSETRRKTEHGQATVPFARGAAGVSDRSRATAPPAVPEGRRAAVQAYFARKK